MNTEKPDLAEVLQHYGISTPVRAGWVKIKCPLHDDTHASAAYNSDEQQWHCFTCDIHGDVYTLIMAKEKMGFRDAVKFGEGFTHGSLPTVLGQHERGLLGVPVGSGNTGKRRAYVPPRLLQRSSRWT